jgi:hypothetical protein
VLYNFRRAPELPQIEHVVRMAVRMFLAAYAVR